MQGSDFKTQTHVPTSPLLRENYMDAFRVVNPSSDTSGKLCLCCKASMVWEGLRSYSTHSPVQGTKRIPCSGIPLHTPRFPLEIRVKEGKDMCLDVILTCSCSTALAWPGDLGSNTTIATTDNQNLRKGLGSNLLRLPTPKNSPN